MVTSITTHHLLLQ